MVAGAATQLREALVASLASSGVRVVVPSAAEFDLTSEAGAARALSAVEPDAVVCLGTQVPRDESPGAGALGDALSAALVLMRRSSRAGVRRFIWVGGTWPEADRVLGIVLDEYRESGQLDGSIVVPDSGGPELAATAVATVVAESLGADGAPVVTLPGAFTDSPAPTPPAPAPPAEGSAFLLPPVEEVTDGDQVIAVILRGSLARPGVSFYSRDHFSQQLGFIHHPAGHVIPPHVHNQVPREVTYTQETLFVREGRVRVDLYRDDRTLLTRRVLATGDVILLCTGGHGFEVLEESSIVEVKQGPYAGDGDKTRFEAAE